jgi:ribosomal protein L37E
MSEETSHVCRRCGKVIAEILKKDAECCACRYGVAASDDHVRQMDCVEWMSGHVGYRFAMVGAFDLWLEDPVNIANR